MNITNIGEKVVNVIVEAFRVLRTQTFGVMVNMIISNLILLSCLKVRLNSIDIPVYNTY